MRAPAARAAAIIASAAVRMRPRHIFVNQLKTSSYSTTTSARARDRARAKPRVSSSSIGS